jgi:preprotein translocase subunit SecD
MKTNYRTVALIVFVLALSIYIDLPKSPGIHFLGISRDFQSHLGLDLVGGVQALLEANLPADQQIPAGTMPNVIQIIENRVNGLGVTEAVVQQAGSNRILVEMPGMTDPEQALATIGETGELEFVDFTGLTPNQASALVDQTIVTDHNPASNPDTAVVTATNQTVYHTVMTGIDLKNVGVRAENNRYTVAFELDGAGTQIFSDFTSTHVGSILAIVLDKRVVSVPRIDTAITTGRGAISGNFTPERANQLAVQLRYGSLPIPLVVVTSQTVGPTLGQDSLNKSLVAGIIGLSVVIIFMIAYYRLPGLLADLALLCYALITFAVFRFIPITLTLPGIAGFVLSIGVAVDANILIFERLKEELRAGRNLHTAIDLGWKRAWSSIRDSNFSTLITCGILYWFGSTFGASIVKGFSVTLALGVLVSMFTAIVVTRTFLHLVLDNINFAAHHRWFGV